MAEILKNFGSNLKISGPFQTVPLEWFFPTKPTYSTKLLRFVNTESANQASAKKSNILLGILSLVILQTIVEFKHKSESIQNHMSYCVTVMLLSTSYLHIHLCRMFAPQIALFINGLIQFDFIHQNRKNNISVLEVLNKVMIKLMLCAQVILPLSIVFGLHWNYPWKASLAGYWLIPKADDLGTGSLGEILRMIIEQVVMLINAWALAYGINAPGFCIAVIYNSCIAVLLRDIET